MAKEGIMTQRVLRVVEGANANAGSRYAGGLSFNCKNEVYQRIIELAEIRGVAKPDLLMQALWYGIRAHEMKVDPCSKIEIVRGSRIELFDYRPALVEQKPKKGFFNFLFSSKKDDHGSCCDITFKVSEVFMKELDQIAAHESLSGFDAAFRYLLHCGLSVIELIHDPDCDVVFTEKGNRRTIIF